MTDRTVFISYARVDMEPVDWLARMRLYLAVPRREGGIDIWDDSRIGTGADWRGEIEEVLDNATAAILLIGPGFLASEFVNEVELPKLLDARSTRGLQIYPLVVGYCPYTESGLGGYNAFNDPAAPLEALEPADQNRVLNELATELCESMRVAAREEGSPEGAGPNLAAALEQLLGALGSTFTTFKAQARRRNELVARMRDRLKITEMQQFEKFFVRHYKDMDEEELFDFQQIRAMTDGSLHEGNRRALELLEENPRLFDVAPRLSELQQHLVFWLNKYDLVFTEREDMCLLYVGVEDGVPFPRGLDDELRSLASEQRAGERRT